MSNYVQLEELLETICNLSNLQTLCIKYCCNLKKLPQGMGKLIDLRHLSFIGISVSKKKKVLMDFLVRNVQYFQKGLRN